MNYERSPRSLPSDALNGEDKFFDLVLLRTDERELIGDFTIDTNSGQYRYLQRLRQEEAEKQAGQETT